MALLLSCAAVMIHSAYRPSMAVGSFTMPAGILPNSLPAFSVFLRRSGMEVFQSTMGFLLN